AVTVTLACRVSPWRFGTADTTRGIVAGRPFGFGRPTPRPARSLTGGAETGPLPLALTSPAFPSHSPAWPRRATALGAGSPLGWRRQAERLEELLHRAEAGGGRPLHRVGPAVLLVPPGHGPLLEQDGRILGRGLGLRRDLPWGERAGEDPVGVRLHRHFRPH